MLIKGVRMKISKKNRFFLMSQGSFNPKIRFLCQKVFSVDCAQTSRQTRTWKQRTLFHGFRNVSFNLSPRIGPTICKRPVHCPHSVPQACFFDRHDVAMPGFSKYFWQLSAEERTHAKQLMDYQNKRGGRVELYDLDVSTTQTPCMI